MVTFLLPNEFREAIEGALINRQSAILVRTIDDCVERRFAPWARFADGAYHLPIRASVSLYNANHVKYAPLLLKSLGRPRDSGYWDRLTSLAQVAYAARDWMTLGALAWAMEWAAVAVQGPHDPALQPPRDHGPSRKVEVKSTAQAMVKKWRGFLEALADHKPESYAACAAGFLLAIPESFVVPPEIAGPNPSTVDDAAWSILDMFWKNNYDAWKTNPSALRALSGSPHVHVVELARSIEQCPLSPRVASIPATPTNPFGGKRVRPIKLSTDEQVPPTKRKFARKKRHSFKGWIVSIWHRLTGR